MRKFLSVFVFAALFLVLVAATSLPTRDVYFVGTFADYHGFRSAFFVDQVSGEAYGPLFSERLPSPTVGTLGKLQFDANSQIKSFVATKTKTDFINISPKISDPVTLGLLANHPISGEVFLRKIKTLTSPAHKERAVYGLLLSNSASPFADDEYLPIIAALYRKGLPGLASLPDCRSHPDCHPLYALIPGVKAWLKKESPETVKQRIYEGMLGKNILRPAFAKEIKPATHFAEVNLDYEDLLKAKDEKFYQFVKGAAQGVTSHALGYVLGFRKKAGIDSLAIAYGIYWANSPKEKWDSATIVEVPWEFGPDERFQFGTKIQFVLKERKTLLEYRLLETKPEEIREALQIVMPTPLDTALGFLARLAKTKKPNWTWQNWHQWAERENLPADQTPIREILRINPDLETAQQMETYLSYLSTKKDSEALTQARLWIIATYLMHQDFAAARKLLTTMDETQPLVAIFKILTDNLERKMASQIPKNVNAALAAQSFKEFIKAIDPRLQSTWLISLEASGFRF